MKTDYLKFVQWSDEDAVFIGCCPDLFIGGICHGPDEQKVYGQLCRLVLEEVVETQRANLELPARTAPVTVPVAV